MTGNRSCTRTFILFITHHTEIVMFVNKFYDRGCKPSSMLSTWKFEPSTKLERFNFWTIKQDYADDKTCFTNTLDKFSSTIDPLFVRKQKVEKE